jgi:hypothetical protein
MWESQRMSLGEPKESEHGADALPDGHVPTRRSVTQIQQFINTWMPVLAAWANDKARDARDAWEEVVDSDRLEAVVDTEFKNVLRSPEFRHPVQTLGIPAMVKRYVDSRRDEIYSEIRDADTQGKRYLFWIVFPSAFVAIVLVCCGGGSAIYGWLERIAVPLPAVGRIMLALAVLGAVVATVTLVVQMGRLTKGAFDRRNAQIRSAITPLARLAINKYVSEYSPFELRYSEAPALVQRYDPTYHVRREEEIRIHSLIRELGAGAVAVSGPRGVGKTSLLEAAQRNDGWPPFDLAVALHSPTSYEARDFIILLYRRLCEVVLESTRSRTGKLLARALNGTRVTIRLFLTAFAGAAVYLWRYPLGLTASKAGPQGWRYSLAQITKPLTPHNTVQLVVFLLGLVAAFSLLGFVRAARIPRSTEELRREAGTRLAGLRYLQNLTEETGATLSLKAAGVQRKATRQLIEKSASLPDIVHEYREFATMVVEWWRAIWGPANAGQVIILIDELDRISSAEDAERMVNGIKGVFGIPYCTYLVTVSEDALAQFERRVVGIRPAIDSTFDEVVRMTILDIRQSRELLGRRLVGFPEAFVALCHSLSGGIPRELIRMARSLIDARRSSSTDQLVPLATLVIAQEVRRLKSGFVGQISRDQSTSHERLLIGRLVDEEWPGHSSGKLLMAARELLSNADENDSPVRTASMQLGVALYYYATVLELFTRPKFQSQLKVAEECHLAQRLAEVRAVMPTSTEVARARLEAIRRSGGFSQSAQRRVKVANPEVNAPISEN